MSVDYDPHEGRAVMAEGSFGESVVFPPNDFPMGKLLLFEAVRGFAAERAGRSLTGFKAPEVESFALPIREALIDGRIKVTNITCAGPYLDVVPTAFRDRQTWRATFEEGIVLPSRPRVGIEPGSLIIDKSVFDRFVTGFRAEELWKHRGEAYIPPLLEFAVQAVHRLGIKDGQYHGDDLAAVLGAFASAQGLHLGERDRIYLAAFITDPKHFRNGWTSSIPPVIEFMLDFVGYYPFDETWKFSRPGLKAEILKYTKLRPDLGIQPTHATHLSTFCGNPEYSSGGPSPNKAGARQTTPSKVRRPHRKTFG